MAAQGPVEEEPTESSENPARSWSRSPWLWTGVVILVVAAALGLSMVVGTDQRDPDLADVDHAAFCREVTAFTDVARGGVDPVSDVPKVRALADAMRAIEGAAPDAIRASAKDWADGYYDAARKLDLILAKYAEDDTMAYDEAIAVVELVGTEKEVAIARVTAYANKACGIDLTTALAAPATTAPPETLPPETVPPESLPPETLSPDGPVGPEAPTGSSSVTVNPNS